MKNGYYIEYQMANPPRAIVISYWENNQFIRHVLIPEKINSETNYELEIACEALNKYLEKQKYATSNLMPDPTNLPEPKPYNTASIAKSMFCRECGWPVVHVCCNYGMSKAPWGGDWWGYCSNKSCMYHDGEDWWTGPDFAFQVSEKLRDTNYSKYLKHWELEHWAKVLVVEIIGGESTDLLRERIIDKIRRS